MKIKTRIVRLFAVLLLLAIVVSLIVFHYTGINPQIGLITRSDTQRKFTHIINIPGLIFMGDWKDSKGNTCLFAYASNLKDNEYHKEFLIFDARLNEISRFAIENLSVIIDSFTADIIEYYEEEKYSVIAFISTNPNDGKLSAFNFDGEKIHEISFPKNIDGFAALNIVDSPTQQGKKVAALLCSQSGYGGWEYRFFDLFTGEEYIEDAKAINSNLPAVDPFCDIIITDWNMDGIDDALYWIAPLFGSAYHLLPVTAGTIEAPISVQQCFVPKSTRVVRYVKDGNIKTLIAGVLDLPASPNDYSFSLFNYIMPEIAPGDFINWQHPDNGTVVSKKFDSRLKSYLNWTNIELADLTGNGIPEIAAIVERTRLVVYDIDGNELYSEVLSPQSGKKPQMRNITAVDFDEDGQIELAIATPYGICLPDLSSLR